MDTRLTQRYKKIREAAYASGDAAITKTLRSWFKLRRAGMATGAALDAKVIPCYRKLHEAVATVYLESSETTSTERYQYLPLDCTRKEIRLLVLEPGAGNEMIRCTLTHAFLDSSPPPVYETISYVCGDPLKKYTICLHGRRVRVLAASKVALCRMRLKDKPRVLWIDAICIDQANIEERGHQVGLMYEIYTRTSQNLIWLVPYYEGEWLPRIPKSTVAMEAIMQEIAVETRDFSDFRDFLYGEDDGPRYSKTPTSIDDQTLVDFLNLLRNPWFSRLWIVQEAALAPRSICYHGVYELPLTKVLRAAAWLSHKIYFLPEEVQLSGLSRAVTMFYATDREYGFLRTTAYPAMSNCLRHFSQFRTFDRRDYIFAILGLWRVISNATMLPDVLKPDYSLTECEVFTIGVRFAIEEGKHLWPLELISEPRQRYKETQDSTWPTWVPTLINAHIDDNAPDLLTGRGFNVADSVPMILNKELDRPNELIVSGISISTISETLPPFDMGSTAREIREAIKSSERRCCESWTKEPVEDVEARLSVVLLGGTLQQARVSNEEALSGYRSMKMYLERNGKQPSLGTLAAVYGADTSCAGGRAIFRTTSGHIGLGPRSARPGDVIVILYGCRLPMVMTHLSDAGMFKLVGTSYVYGIMDGEAVRRHKATGQEDDVFRII